MNVSLYLPDDLLAALDRVARRQRSSRSAAMREAIELYLRRHEAGGWPEEVASWTGEADFPPFESTRGAEQFEQRDPLRRGRTR